MNKFKFAISSHSEQNGLIAASPPFNPVHVIQNKMVFPMGNIPSHLGTAGRTLFSTSITTKLAQLALPGLLPWLFQSPLPRLTTLPTLKNPRQFLLLRSSWKASRNESGTWLIIEGWKTCGRNWSTCRQVQIGTSRLDFWQNIGSPLIMPAPSHGSPV